MSSSRESGYVCSYRTGTVTKETWVRAWNPEQAVQLVRAFLTEEGFEPDVEVKVAPADRRRPERLQ